MDATHGRILIVDDNRLNRLKLSRYLEQEQCAVAAVENGRDALRVLHQEPFDIVLLDIMMPEMDGFEVLARMKRDVHLRDIPVIVISALDEIDSVVRCIEMGAEDYLPKPFNTVLLRARLNACLQKKKLRDLERSYLQQEMMLRQSEKLATLGKLSAGMAHELNNPAAAAQRGAEQLKTAVTQIQQAHQQLHQHQLTADQLSRLAQLDQLAQQRAAQPPELDALTRSDREMAIEEWLDGRAVPNPWEIAPTLVNLGLDAVELDEMCGMFTAVTLPPLLAWLHGSYTIYSLLAEIHEGAGRITAIVKALKSYVYLDQAPVQAVDVHEGLDNTLVMLRSKLKQGVTVHRHYQPHLPRIEAYGSELNQVWTNIIDNAIGAMKGQGEVNLRTYQQGEWVVVEICDNGPGIPPEVQDKIFDPFFTTKAPGEGTGLGLNISHNIIVQKHKGKIVVESRPGKTCFQIKLLLRLQDVGQKEGEK
ncbi:MAG: response regulator [Anaerolineae bacterium]|nr:response regulator [Anaerolineae bacterium]